MDEGALVVFAFATMLGSYLSTFLDSFLRKDIYYKLNSALYSDQWFPTVIYKIFNSMKTKKGHLAIVPL